MRLHHSQIPSQCLTQTDYKSHWITHHLLQEDLLTQYTRLFNKEEVGGIVSGFYKLASPSAKPHPSFLTKSDSYNEFLLINSQLFLKNLTFFLLLIHSAWNQRGNF